MPTVAPPTSQTELTRRSATQLAAAIRAGEVTSREVVDAHIALLDRVNPAINAIVADRYEAARAEADAADARIAAAAEGGAGAAGADGAGLPPLLGVPCTIKESLEVGGMPQSVGLVARRDHRCEADCVIVKRVRDAGAIVLGVTNISELTMWIESDNRVYGRASSPYSPKHSAGGSSGGEGAAVGSGGSPFGIGSDIGGSIRIPAYCGGVFGHKPSKGLVPITGMWPKADGEAAEMVVSGPLTRRAEDLMPVLRVLAGRDTEDPVSRDMELGDPATVALDGLRVVIAEKAFLAPVRAEVQAARERAAGALAASGAVIERVELKDARRAFEAYLGALSLGATVTLANVIEEAGADPFRWGGFLKRGGPHTRAFMLAQAGELIASRAPQGRAKKLVAAAKSFAESVAEVIGDGVMLHPPMTHPPHRHGKTVGRVWSVQPMTTFNLAKVPVTEVPMGLNRHGIPLGVQVAAGPGRDHVSIAVALELERCFGGWVAPEDAGR
jgi:fatty acid amide hydrolase 2